MTGQNALTPLSDTDYVSIEHAVMETERGRWFLAEYARKNRNSDTEVLLDAINRLEGLVSPERGGKGLDQLRTDLLEMSKAISRTKSEISAIIPQGDSHHQSKLGEASGVLDGIVKATELATQDILECAEHTQEVAWTLRENGAQEELCDALDRHATNIYTACSFQDLTSQRIVKVVHVMRYLEDRINAMIGIWDIKEGNQKDAGGAGTTPSYIPQQLVDTSEFSHLSQNDIDGVIIDRGNISEQRTEVVSASVDNIAPIEQEAQRLVQSSPVQSFEVNDDLSDQDDDIAFTDENVDENEFSADHLALVADSDVEDFTLNNVDVDAEIDDEVYLIDPLQLSPARHKTQNGVFEASDQDILHQDVQALTEQHEKSAYFDENFSIEDTLNASQTDVIALDNVRQTQKIQLHEPEAINSFNLIEIIDEDVQYDLQEAPQEHAQEILDEALSSQDDVRFDHVDTQRAPQIDPIDDLYDASPLQAHTNLTDQNYPYAHDAATIIDTSIDEQAFIEDSLSDDSAFDLESIDMDGGSQAGDQQQNAQLQDTPENAPLDPRKAVFADIDNLDTHEKLTRFS